jgi:hypothetical protein
MLIYTRDYILTSEYRNQKGKASERKEKNDMEKNNFDYLQHHQSDAHSSQMQECTDVR